MKPNLPAVLCAVAMVVVIVVADILFFRNDVRERLVANIGIALVFGIFYWLFLRKR